jgi:hypothetical protein
MSVRPAAVTTSAVISAQSETVVASGVMLVR